MIPFLIKLDIIASIKLARKFNEKTKQIYSNPYYDWLSVGDVLADVHHLADPIAAFCGTGYQ